MRLVLITLTLFATVGAASAQRVESCEGFASKYRDLENQALTKVVAHYPAEPGMRVKGRVTVLVIVDRRGHVLAARTLCGHPLLLASAVAASRSWTFNRTRNRARRVGTVSFDFAPTDALSLGRAAHNKSLDASGGSVFRIIIGPAVLE